MTLIDAQQYALSRGIAAESDIARDEALDRLDPILRGLVRRRIVRLARRAELLTSVADPIHRMRLAYLLGAGQAIEDADDRAGVEAAARALPAPASVGRTGPWLCASIALVALIGAGVVFGLQRRARAQRPERAPAAQLLASELTRFVVAVNQNDERLQSSLRQSLTGPDATRLLGASAVTELGSVLKSMQALHAGKGSDAEPLLHEFRTATSRFDKALARAGLPFFVDPDTTTLRDWPEPVLSSYYVQREGQATSGDVGMRVLQLWRIDTLNVRHSLLGFTGPTTPAAIVLLDQVESDLVRFTLPAATPGGQLELCDDLTRQKHEPWSFEVEREASRVVSEYYRGIGALASDAARLGQLLGRRRELLRKWDAALRGQGLELSIPKRLFAPADYAEQLGLHVPRAERSEWADIEAELYERLPSFEALRDRFVRGVERHEVQHRLDYARGLVPVPASLCAWLGLEDPLAAPIGSLAARARDEASAYLAELGRDDDSPLLDLVILSNFVLNRETNNPPYTYAALSVYSALGKALGIDVDTLLGRSISRERFAKLAVLLWARPPNELREGARRAYQSDFGTAWQSVTRGASHENPRFRPEP